MKKLVLLLIAVPRLLFAACTHTDGYSTTICADSPVHYYRFSSTTTTDADIAGNSCEAGKDLNLQNSPTESQPGIPGAQANGSILWNGTTQYASTSVGETAMRPAGGSGVGWSAEIWIKFVSIPSLRSDFSSMDAASNYMWALYGNGTGIDSKIQFNTYQSGSSCAGATYGAVSALAAANTGVWYYVVGTTLGAGGGNSLQRMRLYINGVIQGTTTSFTNTMCPDGTIYDLAVARRNDNSLFLNGYTDELGIYQDCGTGVAGSGELTQTQVTTHYNAGNIPVGGNWPYTVMIPRIPRFRNDGYFDRVVEWGYNTGLFTMKAMQPQFMTVGLPNFEVVPNGNVH